MRLISARHGSMEAGFRRKGQTSEVLCRKDRGQKDRTRGSGIRSRGSEDRRVHEYY